MAAHEHVHPVQFQQLALFATGSEVKDITTTSSDLTRSAGETMPQLWSRKETESREPAGTMTGGPLSGRFEAAGAGVFDSIKEKGYSGTPLKIAYDNTSARLTDGHHRVAAAAALEKEGATNWIPLEHIDPDQQKRQDAHFGPSTAKAKRTQETNENWG